MSRPEYEKFIHLYRSKNGYQLFSRELEGNEDVGIAYAKVCEMKKTYVNTGANPWKRESTGVWVDVVPIDGAPSDKNRAFRKIWIMYWYWRLTYIVRAKNPISYNTAKSPLKKIRIFIKKTLSIFFPDFFILAYIKMCQEYDFLTSDYLANYSTMQNKFREWQPKSTMLKFVLHKFEDGEFYIMEDYKTSLTSLYGNYMSLPPKEQQVAHIDNSYYWR